MQKVSMYIMLYQLILIILNIFHGLILVYAMYYLIVNQNILF